MLGNGKKAPALGRSPKRLQRPYPKADITIEDQQREQKKLLNAGKAFSGYNRNDLDIIAISYEHKCFSEAKTKEEYLVKIRKKLVEWKYVPEGGEEVNTVGPLKLPLNPPGQAHKQPQSPKRSHHQRHRSGPPLHGVYETPKAARITPGDPASPIKTGFPGSTGSPAAQIQGTTAFQPPFPQLHPPHYQATQEQEGQLPFQSRAAQVAHNPGSSFSNRNSPPHEPPKIANSPQSQPMCSTMSNSSSGSSQDIFVDIFDPKFLDKIDLNDPDMRVIWINSVWEYFCSGGHWNGQRTNGSNAGSQGNSPVPLYSSPYRPDDSPRMQGIQHGNGVNGDVDMVGSPGGFNHRVVNGYGRRQSEDLTRINSLRSDNIHNSSQWMTSELLHMSMDIGMGNMNNMDGIIAGDGVSSGISSQKWTV